jgi:hypothetical protein
MDTLHNKKILKCGQVNKDDFLQACRDKNVFKNVIRKGAKKPILTTRALATIDSSFIMR